MLRIDRGDDDDEYDNRSVPPALIGPSAKLRTARKFTLIGNRRRPRKAKKDVATLQPESHDNEVEMGGTGVVIEQPEQNDGAQSESGRHFC